MLFGLSRWFPLSVAAYMLVGATAFLEAPLLAPCVLVVPDAAGPEARLALPDDLDGIAGGIDDAERGDAGRHDELVALKGLYYAMWRQQIGERGWQPKAVALRT